MQEAMLMASVNRVIRQLGTPCPSPPCKMPDGHYLDSGPISRTTLAALELGT